MSYNNEIGGKEMALELPFNTDMQFEDIKASALETIKNSFPIEGKSHKLVLKDVWIDDKLSSLDLQSQKDAKLGGKSWAVPVHAAIDLVDIRSGKIINSVKRMKLIDLPKITPRSSYIVDGNEYQVVNQLRLKPGVYTRIKNNGELESKVNLAKGANYEILLNQERGVFIIKIGTANIKLYPILRDLGVSDLEIQNVWGSELLESNRKASSGVMETEIKKMRAALFKKPASSRDEAIREIKEYLSETRIDPETTKMTMGQSFTKADVSLMLATSGRLLETARGEKPADDRDSLVFKSLHSVEDFLKERLSLNEKKIKNAISNKLDRKFKISEIMNKKVFDDPVKTLFTNTSLAAPTEQINPLHMYSGQLKLTITGEGGIQNEQAITPGARAVHPSEVGFVDPVHTPQSGMVGAVTRLAIGMKKRGNEILTSVRDAKTGKLKHISPVEFEKSNIAFADQYTQDAKGNLKPLSKKIKILGEGNTSQKIQASKVDYVIVDPKSMFSLSTNLIPFLNSTQGNRALMAAGQYEQALALKEREEPLVQVDTGLGTTAEKDVGTVLAHTSPVNGEVVKTGRDYIEIKDKNGEVHKVGLYNDFPLNQKTYLNASILVSAGDKVKKGQLIADNNYTKNGVLSLGTNLKIAYMPFKGYNFEDGIVISERAANKLTSEHMHKKSILITEGGVLDKKKFLAYFPASMSAAQAGKLDDDGVIKEGSVVEFGDPIIAYMTRNVQTPERMMVSKLHRSLVKPYIDKHEEWNYEFEGVVSKVVKGGKEVTVYIKTEEPATIGDKISGRYGNKGIISMIMPDSEMPRTTDGDPVEVILNPIGIPSRLNPSQVLETAASKIAEKTGKPFTIRNFSPGSNYDKVLNEMKKLGIKDKEILIDPEDGKPLGAPVNVGKQFMLKLDHPVRKKFSARGRGAYTRADIAPAASPGESGQSLDHLTLYSMLSHGSKNLLRESATYKAEKNDEFWRALQLGQPLPPPKPTFAFEKFLNLMTAAGVNVEKEGSKFNLSPMTDKHVDVLTNGELKNPLMLKGKNLAPEKGGLMDPSLTGGPDGSNWTHIKLTEPIPNPMFEDAIKTLTGIKQDTFDGIVSGKLFVDDSGNISDDPSSGSTGGKGIRALLKLVKVGSKLSELRTMAKTAKPNQLNKLNKEIRYLKALEQNNLRPEDYVITKVPVIPPKFRPVYPMEDGSLMTSDPNFLYRDTFLANQKLKELEKLPDAEKTDLRRDLYKSIKAVQGLGNPITYKDYRGFISTIKGKTQPKSGFFQGKLVSRRQDMSGRSTIVPEPLLGVDQVGLPRKMAWKIYEPHIIRELVQRGYTPLDAQKQYKEQTPIAQKALEAATSKRPVLLNRSPSLHKFSIMAFKPTLTTGKTIKIHPLVVKGFNADFNGDMQLTLTLIHLTNETMRFIMDTQGKNYLEERKLTARMREVLPVLKEDGEVFVFDLEDFPHGSFIKSKEGRNGQIDFFAALPGTKVLAYDEKTGQVDWKDVAYWSKHIDREVEIVELKTGKQIISDDDPRAVYGIEFGTMSFSRNNPTSALENKMFVPIAERFTVEDIEDEPVMAMGFNNESDKRSKQLKDFIDLDKDFGYFLGVMTGDGWSSSGVSIVVAGVDHDVFNKFSSCAKKLFKNEDIHINISSRLKADDTSYGKCDKLTIYSQALSRFVKPLIGHRAANKHLPPFFFKAPREFREGLLAGLIDTDGSISISNGKKNPQLMAAYYSNSLRLVREIKLLASSLGIKSRITASKTPKGEPCWVLSFSNYDVKNKWNGKYMACQYKLDKLNSIEVEQTPALMKSDIVPISFELAKHITKLIGAKRDAPKDRKSVYTVFAKAKKCASVSRFAAKKLTKYVKLEKILEHKDGKTWWNIVNNDSVYWDQVKSVEKTGFVETGYDLTVPGYETFMNTEGVILSNTMSVHVPATEKGRVEAFNMLPTNNIFNPATGEIMLMPQNEMILGLYLLTKEGKSLNKKYSSIAKAKQAMENGEISINSIVTIGNQKTSVGRSIVNGVLPEKIRDPNMYLNKSGLKNLLQRIAEEEKGKFGEVVDALKDLGNKHAYKTGFTVGMEDVAPLDKVREKIERMAEKVIGTSKSSDKKIKVYTAAGEKMNEDMYKEMAKRDTGLFHMANSGAKGDLGQLRQITTAPNLVQDYTGSVIPEPVLRSYSEGLDSADYWNTMYGARAGTIGRSLQSSVPGYFSKRMVASAMGGTVTKIDCGTDKGIDENINDSDIIGRYLSGSNPAYLGEKNDEITSLTINKARRKGKMTINVRSPLTCEASEGVCVKCFGKTLEGISLEVGDNAGVLSATSITEPVMQMGMNAFHTGGVAGAGGGISAVAKGYERIAQILEMPEIVKGKATLSTEDGKVDKVEKNPAGGHFVFVNQARHFVPQTRNVTVKVGDKVNKGDYLSDGVIKPQELLDLKGVDAVRRYMTDELKKTYEQPIKKNIFETIVKEMTNTTEILDPGSATDFEPGDYATLGKVDDLNRSGKNVVHKPILKGINTLPLVSEDWMARLGNKEIMKTIREGASKGWSSDIHGTHPIPAYVYGAEFGLGTEGKY